MKPTKRETALLIKNLSDLNNYFYLKKEIKPTEFNINTKLFISIIEEKTLLTENHRLLLTQLFNERTDSTKFRLFISLVNISFN